MATWEAALVARTPSETSGPTFTEVCGLKWTGLSYEDVAGDPGRIDIGVPIRHLPTAAKTRLRDLELYPCELWLHRDGVRKAAGPLMSYTIQGDTLTAYGTGLLGYLGYWPWDIDQTYTGADQATIVAGLIDTMQARTYGSFGIDTSHLAATEVYRDLKLLASEGRNVLDIVVGMGDRDNGYQLTIDPQTRAVEMHTPRQGVDRSGDVYLDQRNVASPEVFVSVAPGQIASEVLGVSSGAAAGESLTSSASNPTLRATFGRAGIARSWPDIKVQATLDDHVARVAEDYATARTSVSPDLAVVTGASIEDFDAGDIITYSFDDGLGLRVITPRVRTKKVTASKGREALSVRFY